MKRRLSQKPIPPATRKDWVDARAHAGGLLRQLRIRHQINTKDLAEFLHISYDVLMRYEVGKRSMSLEMAWRISKIFNISMKDLVLPRLQIKRPVVRHYGSIIRKDGAVLSCNPDLTYLRWRRRKSKIKKIQKRETKREERRKTAQVMYVLVGGVWRPETREESKRRFTAKAKLVAKT